ncbi:MAG: hypothetical protein KatS3mg129_0585 [Leptospiraceae bacterium]|nr:MAG: hypothetical protein KatS3mg129_0585 [Leptospiraceae bacterium]
MNHCQNCYSCFSCCGLFNFKLDILDLYNILEERTKLIKEIFYKNQTSFPRKDLLEYRNKRELLESKIEKYDYQIYICPFLGFINEKEKRVGCLIHPSITKEHKSQDVSFYGSSICLSYDCRVKEDDKKDFLYMKIIQRIIKEIVQNYKNVITEFKNIDEHFLYHYLYSRFMGDYIFYTFIKTYFDLKSILKQSDLFLLFLELCLFRLKYNYSVTSFEINYERFVENNYKEAFKKVFLNGEDNNNLVQKYNKLLKIC